MICHLLQHVGNNFNRVNEDDHRSTIKSHGHIQIAGSLRCWLVVYFVGITPKANHSVGATLC